MKKRKKKREGEGNEEKEEKEEDVLEGEEEEEEEEEDSEAEAARLLQRRRELMGWDEFDESTEEEKERGREEEGEKKGGGMKTNKSGSGSDGIHQDNTPILSTSDEHTNSLLSRALNSLFVLEALVSVTLTSDVVCIAIRNDGLICAAGLANGKFLFLFVLFVSFSLSFLP